MAKLQSRQKRLDMPDLRATLLLRKEYSFGFRRGVRQFGVIAVCWALFCIVPIGVLQAVQSSGNDQVVEKLFLLLGQYHGREFRVEQIFNSPEADLVGLKCRIASDGMEAVVEKTYAYKGGESSAGYYCNREYAYSVNRTPTNWFSATATTESGVGKNRFGDLGFPLIFFLGRTLGGQRLSDFFSEANPVVTLLSTSGESRKYAVTVESRFEESYRFEVLNTENSFELTRVVVEKTPESISARSGQSVSEIRKVFRRRRFAFKDFEMRDGRIVAFSSDPALDELPSGKTKAYGDASRVTVTSSRPLASEIVRSTKMFSLFEMPERISTTMLCDSLAPHAIINGSLVRLDVQYASELQGEATLLKKTWFQKYWVVICCVALIGTAFLGMMAYRRMKHAH